MQITLTDIINEFDVSHQEVADRLGLPRGRVTLIANGQATPTKLEEFALEGLATALKEDRLNRPAVRRTTEDKPIGVLPAFLEGSSWTQITARLGILCLAKNPNGTTYRDFYQKGVVPLGGKEKIGTYTKLRHPLGLINDVMQEASRRLGKPVPPLAALVCNQRTKVPSGGINPYLRQYFRDTHRPDLEAQVPWDNSEDAPKHLAQIIHREIAEFPDWNEVIHAVGLTGDPEEDR